MQKYFVNKSVVSVPWDFIMVKEYVLCVLWKSWYSSHMPLYKPGNYF